MSQEEYRDEGRRLAQSRNGHGSRRIAPSHPEEERRFAPHRQEKRLDGWDVLLYAIFVPGISAFLTSVDWIWANNVLALNKSVLIVVVEIDEGDTVDQVADKPEEQDLIKYEAVFKLFCSPTHTSGKAREERVKVTPGTYELNTNMDYRALISSAGSSSANHMTTTVTIPEGMTETQIFALLEGRGASTVKQLEEATANYDFKLSFLKGVVPLDDPRRLEGYLLPDTYEFYMDEEPVNVLNKMILRFDETFADEMRQEVRNDGRTIQGVVTVASMIEKEADGSDQTKVASITYNHLDNPTNETAGYLNINATILYAIGGTEVDPNADTPYNTRTHKGLTPTAIASPDADALKIAMYPDSTRYYFYTLRSDGKHHFLATYREQ